MAGARTFLRLRADEWQSVLIVFGTLVAAYGTFGTLLYSLLLVKRQEAIRREDLFRRAKMSARQLKPSLQIESDGHVDFCMRNAGHVNLFFDCVCEITDHNGGRARKKEFDEFGTDDYEQFPVSTTSPPIVSADVLRGWTLRITYRDEDGFWWEQDRKGRSRNSATPRERVSSHWTIQQRRVPD